jgi:acyl carrier protein
LEALVSQLPSGVDPQVFATVQRCFCDALELDPDEVGYSDKVLDDLGAESLDLLDVVFRLERAFQIQIPRGGLEQKAKELGGEPGEIDGRLTAAGVERLRELMPEVPATELAVGMKASELPRVFRVGTFYNIVVALLQHKQQAAV